MTALVTGSSRNLGAAIALELAHRGSTVVITHRASQKEAANLAGRLHHQTGRTHPTFYADLSSGSTTKEFLDRYLEEIGPTDILVNNAGPFAMEPFEDLPEPEWDRIFDSNVKAAHLCAQALVPGMRQKGRGRVVNLSAGSAYIRNHSIY
ncbi:MAG: SDR family NAD(P)-dependent oxidoreductase, partial [Acidimicrobiia bacterium]